MPDDRTTVTELGTALGMLPFPDPRAAIAARPATLHIDDRVWSHLDAIFDSGQLGTELGRSFANGQAFLESPDALRGRPPMGIEWTGGRRPPGDEVAPIDLRIDHVYLVSCKYESDILANASPGRLFEGLLSPTARWDRTDWYEVTAHVELTELYHACVAAGGLSGLPDRHSECTKDQLQTLQKSVTGRAYPDAASRDAYRRLCRQVARSSAERWQHHLEETGTAAETMLWRLLRIGSAPYFVLGQDRRSERPARFRIADPWDWRRQFELTGFSVVPAEAGQPRVDWSAAYRRRSDGAAGSVDGHVEIRWSHGRFAQPPEAKVYLDTPMSRLPGYEPLTGVDVPQLSLFPPTGCA
ncbi:MAG: hypothetical protein WBG41_11930 [Acidimicrobiales bacterium]